MTIEQVARIETHGRTLYGYADTGRLIAIDSPVRSRHWCVEHDAPGSRTQPGQCVELVRRLDQRLAGLIYNDPPTGDEPGDCQIVPNVTLRKGTR